MVGRAKAALSLTGIKVFGWGWLLYTTMLSTAMAGLSAETAGGAFFPTLLNLACWYRGAGPVRTFLPGAISCFTLAFSKPSGFAVAVGIFALYAFSQLAVRLPMSKDR